MSRTLFSESFQEKANYIRTSAVNLLEQYDLEDALSDKKKNRVINDVLDECIYYTPIEILEDSITAELEHQTLSKNQEDDFLSEYEAALSQCGQNISKITYTIPYTGTAGNFDMGTMLQKEKFWGEICEDDIILEFYFLGDVDTNAPIIKQKKDNFIRLVRDIQPQIESQLADLRNELSVLLTKKANKMIEAKRKNIADAKMFL